MSELYKLPDDKTREIFFKYIPSTEIKGLVGSLGHTISKKYEGKELVLIGILKGSCLFMADLIREIRGVNLSIDFIRISAKGRSKEETGTIILQKDLSEDISGKHVLIIEEIIDTGRALKFVKERIQLSQPKSLEVVTLFDKPYKRKIDIQPDLIGRKIDDYFIVGNGLDLEEYGRNLNDIYFIKYPH